MDGRRPQGRWPFSFLLSKKPDRVGRRRGSLLPSIPKTTTEAPEVGAGGARGWIRTTGLSAGFAERSDQLSYPRAVRPWCLVDVTCSRMGLDCAKVSNADVLFFCSSGATVRRLAILSRGEQCRYGFVVAQSSVFKHPQRRHSIPTDATEPIDY